MALAYFALGDNAEADASAYLTDYYAWLGEETADFIATAPPRTRRPCASTSPPSTRSAATS